MSFFIEKSVQRFGVLQLIHLFILFSFIWFDTHVTRYTLHNSNRKEKQDSVLLNQTLVVSPLKVLFISLFHQMYHD